MCGICGTAGFANRTQLKAMNYAIVHRGPDDGGVQVISNGAEMSWIGLANRRLSIIDLSPAGHQPMCNEDGSVWLTYNGETFNFLDLRLELDWKPGDISFAHTLIPKYDFSLRRMWHWLFAMHARGFMHTHQRRAAKVEVHP